MHLDDSYDTWKPVSDKERGWTGGKHGVQQLSILGFVLISVNSLGEPSSLQSA